MSTALTQDNKQKGMGISQGAQLLTLQVSEVGQGHIWVIPDNIKLEHQITVFVNNELEQRSAVMLLLNMAHRGAF